MKVKSVVKVMNFHSLLRVEKSRRRAERYSSMQVELETMMKSIMNNRNLRMDKIIRMPDPDKPVLRIYLGSDFGFCGSINTSVAQVMNEDVNSEKIVIGKKFKHHDEADLTMLQEEIEERFPEIKEYFRRAVTERCWSAVELVYNRYYSISQIKRIVHRIYPLELEEDDFGNASGDYIIEGDPERMLTEMIVLYLTEAFRIATASAYASENITRRNVTQESLKKIDEIEEENRKAERKEKNRISFSKTIDTYITQAYIK